MTERRHPVPSRKYPLINASDAALHFLHAYNVRVKPEAIRQWAARKRIGSHSFRRERYDLREIEAYARKIGLIPPPPDPSLDAPPSR